MGSKSKQIGYSGQEGISKAALGSTSVQEGLRAYLAASASQGAAPRAVIACDCSGSMADIDGGKKSRMEHLKDAVRLLLAEVPSSRLVAFNEDAWVAAGPEDLGVPDYGTNMAAGIELSASLKPAVLIVISDGLPQDEDEALEAAGRAGCRVEVVYVGPEVDPRGREFMAKLARGGGKVHIRKLANVGAIGLAQTVRGLLPG